MRKKKHRKTHDTINKKKKTFEDVRVNFSQQCDFCGQELSVIKYKTKSQIKNIGEVITATCTNDNFKGLGVRCELYLIQVRFRSLPWC